MKNAELVISVTALLEEHSISESELKDSIEKFQIPLLCRCPKTVEVHVSGSAFVPNDDTPRTVNIPRKRHKGTPFNADHDYHSKVDLDIIFLSISTAEWEKIANYGETVTSNFTQCFFHQNGNGLTQASAHFLLKSSLKPLKGIIEDADLFTTSTISPHEIEKILISKNDIFIKTEDSNRIIESAAETNKHHKENKKPIWQSDNLFELNKASDIFISETNITSEKERMELIGKIKKYLEGKFDFKGKDSLEQAAFAILPNEHYHAEVSNNKLPIKLSKQYPKHASTALILINTAAKSIWKDSQKTVQKAPAKRAEIITFLQNSEWGLTEKLISAAATIISLKSRK
ncbi:hypothetical protein [Pseudomonas paeninsulae]|uniref:hypothetical protein n=1 Tax=Pseudomonas paeninsulae TaxID=3110772 RepID=UPI002D790A08|nr:hypothetical protein [Pseudomonas sp. IT1137]